MIAQLLATSTPEPDAMISGAWLIAIAKVVIIALGTAGAAWIVALKKGEKQGAEKERSKVTLEDPVPEVPVKKVYSPPSFYQHMDLVRRVEKVELKTDQLAEALVTTATEIRKQASENFVDILNAGHERENRLSEKLDGIARGFHGRVDELMKFNPEKKS